jgi:plasmid stability protein
MSVNLSIKNASDEVVAALKSRARQNHRSLQGELMAIIEAAAMDWLTKAEAHGFREGAIGWGAKDAAALRQTNEQRTEHAADEVSAPSPGGREQDIRHLVELLKQGLPLGGRRYTRDEMHER